MKDELFGELVASLKEAGSIMREETHASRSFVVSPLDIKKIREGYDLTQNQFAGMLGISIRTLRNWEQGRRVPEGPARVLIQVAAKHPEALLDVVRNHNDS
jgi:putative transcriptional regulator